jgi:hypothetical protein
MARGLTQKQETFAIEYVRLGNGVEAHAIAFPSDNYSVRSRYREVSRLLAEEKVKARILEIREEIAARSERTGADVIRELWDNAMQAKAAVPVKDNKGMPTGEFTANWAASNQALVAVGNYLGIFEKGAKNSRSPLDGVNPEQVRALVEAAQREKARREEQQLGPVEPEPGSAPSAYH